MSTDAQRWTAQTDGTVWVGGDCLTAAGSSAQLGRCNGAAGQQWRVGADGRLVAQATGRCLADPGDSPVAGTRLAIEACGGDAGQLWHVE